MFLTQTQIGERRHNGIHHLELIIGNSKEDYFRNTKRERRMSKTVVCINFVHQLDLFTEHIDI
jgi:hypothetical protein